MIACHTSWYNSFMNKNSLRRVDLRTQVYPAEKAFTIIELLVVIAIIALLTGIIMTNLTSAKSRARDAKRISDMGQIALALELFYDRCGSYPIAEGYLSLSEDANGYCPSGVTFEDFMSVIPSNPAPYDLPYYYYNAPSDEVDFKAKKYLLRVTLEGSNSVLDDDVDSIPIADWPDIASNFCSDASNAYCIIGN